MTENNEKQLDTTRSNRPVATVSAVLGDGAIVETVFDREARRTAFAVWRDGVWRMEPLVTTDNGERLVPYSANNNLLKHGVVLLPSRPEEYGSEADLIRDIQQFVHRYVDVNPLYEQIASYYVLFTWVYDRFNELPYLRVRGDAGSGKSRFLLTIGSLCYKPIFASGASTVSPIFRLIDTFRGTLVVDESDWRQTDEKAEVVKILNNGNGKGFPVLRSEANGKGEFNPTAYTVFGPKLIATRGFFVEDCTTSSTRRRTRVRQLLDDLARTMQEVNVQTHRVSIDEVHQLFAPNDRITKHDIASGVTEHFPALASRLPPKRKAWMSEAERMAIFDATAFGLTYYFLTDATSRR